MKLTGRDDLLDDFDGVLPTQDKRDCGLNRTDER